MQRIGESAVIISASPSRTPASHHRLLLCFRRKVYSMELLHDSGSPLTMTISYLDKLNPQQRRAVEHGGSALAEAGPLLIIAGAGSGKTNTLAHRVAHLIVDGADPRRIMLLTFSRRAAAEMMRRVERIVANVMHDRAEAMTEAIVWAGTFHAVGARLLREYADVIGLDSRFIRSALRRCEIFSTSPANSVPLRKSSPLIRTIVPRSRS